MSEFWLGIVLEYGHFEDQKGDGKINGSLESTLLVVGVDLAVSYCVHWQTGIQVEPSDSVIKVSFEGKNYKNYCTCIVSCK